MTRQKLSATLVSRVCFAVLIGAGLRTSGALGAQAAPVGSGGQGVTGTGGAAATGATRPPAVEPRATNSEAPDAAGAIRAMKDDLLRLVSANEVYYAEKRWYSEDLRTLKGYQASPGVAITILSADADGWTAEATSTLMPGKSCVIHVGPVKNPPKTRADGRSASDAVPVCDRP